jgi:hypothetical protein
VKRRLFNLLVPTSAILCAITVCVIFRSLFITDMVEYFTPGNTVGGVLHRSRVRVVCGRGIAFLLIMQEGYATTGPADMATYRGDYEAIPPWSYNKFPPTWPTPTDHQWLGFGFSDESYLHKTGWMIPRSRELRVPLWLPAIWFAVLPAIWLRKRRRFVPGACPNCGYDLRATPDRCPECGMKPQVSSSFQT